MKKIIIVIISLLAVLAIVFFVINPHKKTYKTNSGISITVEGTKGKNDFNSVDEIFQAQDLIYNEYLDSISARRNELNEKRIVIDGISMQVNTQVIGNPDKNGYPLYIAFHGGSTGDPAFENEQFEIMTKYIYSQSISSGIYITTRGLTDVYDQHYRPYSFVFYDRIIEDAIAFYNADPNRVYLVGFSSGGDGVYAVAPRIADRLAAANMSAGYPHVHILENLYNLPFYIQVGENDTAYSRNVLAAEFDGLLDALNEKYCGGFPHETYIHKDGTHNSQWSDNVIQPQPVVDDNYIQQWLKNPFWARYVEKSTSAISLLNSNERNALPERVVWNTGEYAGLRKSQMFYWLDRDGYLKNATIVASFDKERNTIKIEQCDAQKGTLKIYLSPDMVDVFEKVNIEIMGTTVSVRPLVSGQIMQSTLSAKGDKNYIFTSEIDIRFDLKNNKISIKSVSDNTADYSVNEKDSLLFWDDDFLFYADQSLFGLTSEQLCDKLDITLSSYENNENIKTANTPEMKGVYFYFNQGNCHKIMFEQELSEALNTMDAFKNKFGSYDTFSNGGMAFHRAREAEHDGQIYIQQEYELF